MIMTSVRGSAEIPPSNLGIVKDLENYINYFEAHTYVQREISVNVWGKTDKTWEKKQQKKKLIKSLLSSLINLCLKSVINIALFYVYYLWSVWIKAWFRVFTNNFIYMKPERMPSLSEEP